MFHSAGTIEKKFESWGAKLDAIVAKAEQAGADAKGDAREGVADLKAKREAVKVRLDELRAAGGDKWDTLKDGIEAAWKDLEVAFVKMSN